MDQEIDWIAVQLVEEMRMDLNDLPNADIDNNEDLWKQTIKNY
jgi:hypothetical protein